MMPEVRYKPGDTPSSLTILRFDQEKFDKKGTRTYFIRHEEKATHDQEHEPCMRESKITHYALEKRVTEGKGEFCKLCSPRNRSKTKDSADYTKTREIGDVVADTFRIMNAFKLMSGFKTVRRAFNPVAGNIYRSMR